MRELPPPRIVCAQRLEGRPALFPGEFSDGSAQVFVVLPDVVGRGNNSGYDLLVRFAQFVTNAALKPTWARALGPS